MATRHRRRRSGGAHRRGGATRTGNGHARGASRHAGRAAGAAGRAMWSGSISFGLLQIPVSLLPAEQRSEEIHFRLLDKRDLSPIRNVRVNAESGKALEWKDIVKGYEYEKGSFVTIEDEDLKKANPEATQTIDIQDFVPADAIAPAYFETPYYAVPNKRSRKAYQLLLAALAKKNAAAVARFVLRTREHLCALMPVGDAIMVETLRFGHELREPSDLPLPEGAEKALKVSTRELDMAERLIQEMMTDWKPDKYQDRFHDDVMKMIEQKVKTGKVRTPRVKAKGEEASNVVDLVALLRKSVEQKGRAPSREAA
jgi:DNA end-binding protein Ku